MITFKRAISFLIPAFGFIVLSVPSVSAQGIFQGWAANQQINAIQRGLSSGLITQSQATDLMNHANDLASREQRLLQNDGGVLTPNDSSKIMKNLQKEGQRLQDMISSNGYNGTTGNGTGATGITGLLGSLLGVNSSTAVSNYGYGGTSAYPLNGYAATGYPSTGYPSTGYPYSGYAASGFPVASYQPTSYYGNAMYQQNPNSDYYGGNRGGGDWNRQHERGRYQHRQADND